MIAKTIVEEIRARNLRAGDIIVGGYTQSGVRLEVQDTAPAIHTDSLTRVNIKGLDAIFMGNSKTLKVERTVEVHEYKPGTIIEFDSGAAFARRYDGWAGIISGARLTTENDETIAKAIELGEAKIIREPR